MNTRSDILKIWKSIIKINPFSDESYKDYMLYLDTILQDEVLAREESKNYIMLKNNKSKEKINDYQNMFLIDTSLLMLVDGYLLNGKIIYTTPNISYFCAYNDKEILNLSVDDLLPNVVQPFHKELIDDAIKYSNLNYKFDNGTNSLFKNKDGRLINIKLFIKPVPNLYYGLIYFVYIQKIQQSEFIITLNKDLKINGLTEAWRHDSSFTIDTVYHLNSDFLGCHIGLIIPDILHLIEYKDDEYNIIKKDFELKGYLYRINDINEMKTKITNIVERIKNMNTNNIHIQYETPNINDDFNDYMSELSNKKIKPFSIFYKIKMYSFLEGKYKYYRVYITDDIITGNEKELILNKENNESRKSKNYMDSNISKISNCYNVKKIIKRKSIKARKERQLDSSNINNTNNIQNKKIETNNNEIENNGNNDSNENELNQNMKKKKAQKNNYSESQISNIQSGFNKIKLDVINKKEVFPIRMAKILSFIYLIVTIVFIVLSESFVKKYFIHISNFCSSNLLFNMTKVNVGIIYIMVTNIKWELHSCLIPNPIYDFSKLYDQLIISNIDYILKFKNYIPSLGAEYNTILAINKKIQLNIYGTEKSEEYAFTLNNILDFIISAGIDIIKVHNSLSQLINENNIFDTLSYGYNELSDLQRISYLYYTSDVNGFSNEQKKTNIAKKSTDFTLICNVIVLFSIVIFFIIYIFRIHIMEMYFLDKLIYFNSIEFDKYLKNLEEIKKKIQNDNINEEEEKDDIDMNDLDSKKISKKDDEERKKNLSLSEKFGKKGKKKDLNKTGKAQKQKSTKKKVMGIFFIKKNLIFTIEILIIMVISLSYYIVSLLIEYNKKKSFLEFDKINDEMISVFKECFDNFIYLKDQLDQFEENNLVNCKAKGNILYKMDLPEITNLKLPNFGNNVMKITSNFRFRTETLSNFTLLFSEDVCKSISEKESEIIMCLNSFSEMVSKGMEHSISKIGSLFGTIIEELTFINNNANDFKAKMNNSKFHYLEIFLEYYFQKSLLIADGIFSQLRTELLSNIKNIIIIVLIIYIVIILFLFGILLYFINNFQKVFDSFLLFVAILPFKYILEDKNLHNEIIIFGNNYY